MERTEDTLSTRDLAGSTQEPAAEDPPVRDDVRVLREGDGEPAERVETAEPIESAEPVESAEQVETAERAETAEPAAAADEDGSLLPDDEEADFRRRWEDIQTRFVDDPRQAVEDADALVAGVMKRIAEGFAQARDGLEGQWSAGADVGTEELRVALQRYRSFFRRLLSA
jgi:hypothetical protein